MGKPYLQAHHRFKNGKDHCYWSIVEKVRGPHDQWRRNWSHPLPLTIFFLLMLVIFWITWARFLR